MAVVRMLAAQVAVIGLLLVSVPALACDACEGAAPDLQDPGPWNGDEVATESMAENGTTIDDGGAADAVLRTAGQVMEAAGEDPAGQVEEVKDEAIWTASEVVLDVYDEAMKFYPRSVPQVEVKGVAGGGQPVPKPPIDPENHLQTRPQPTKDEPPDIDDEVRKIRDDLLSNPSGGDEAEEDASEESSTLQKNATDDRSERVAAQVAPREPSTEPTTPANTPPVDEGLPTDTDIDPKSRTTSQAEPPWNTGAAIVGGLAGVAFLTWLLSRGGFLARLAGYLPMARLFSRQTGDQILKHPGRRRIYESIVNQPGITGPQLGQVTGFATSTLRYHLTVLRREQIVHIAQDGKILHYHAEPVRGDPLAEAQNCLFRRRRALLAKAILANPGTNQKAMAKRTGLPPSRVCSYVRDLARHGLVDVEKAGRHTHHFASSSLTALQEQGRIPEP